MKKVLSIVLSLVFLLSVLEGVNATALATGCNHNYKTTIEKTTPTHSGYVEHICTKCGDEHYKYLEKITVRLSKKVFAYNGKVRKPKVSANYSSDCYKVIYPKGMKKPGKYTVKIVFNDEYHSGTAKKDFWIVKKPAQVKGVKAVENIYDDECEIVAVTKWKKVKGASGYQVKVGDYEEGSGNKIYWYSAWNGKKIIRKGASKTSFKTNFIYGSDYGFSFVKVRAYKTVNGKKVYGKWSKAVKLKRVYRQNNKSTAFAVLNLFYVLFNCENIRKARYIKDFLNYFVSSRNLHLALSVHNHLSREKNVESCGGNVFKL